MKKLFTRILALALVLVTCVGFFPASVSAASYSHSAMDSIMNSWNATTYSKSNACTYKYCYQGAYQCAAFSRYAFMQLYGHKDTTNNSNVKLTVKTYTSSADLLKDLKTLAAPGDAIRFTRTNATSHTHIFNLFDIDAKGNITVYESNKDGKTNKAYRNTYASIAKLVNNATGVRTNEDGKFNNPVEMKIIHSKKNTASAGSFSGCCTSHTYSGGICTKCGSEYKDTVTTIKATAFKVTKSGGAPVWSRPYSTNSRKITTMKKNSVVVAVAKATNQAGNVWYKLTTGEWIFSGNVRKTSSTGIQYIKTNIDCLNLRAGAGTSYKVLTSIPAGAAVEIEAIAVARGNWVWVTYNGITGCVSGKYLTATAPKA